RPPEHATTQRQGKLYTLTVLHPCSVRACRSHAHHGFARRFHIRCHLVPVPDGYRTCRRLSRKSQHQLFMVPPQQSGLRFDTATNSAPFTGVHSMSAQPAPSCANTELTPEPVMSLPAQGRGSAAARSAIHDYAHHDVLPTRNLATFLATSFNAETKQLF